MKRIVLVDAARGMAIMMMAAYHFCFDLDYFGVIHQDFNHETFWLTARAIIVSLFLTLSGISLVLASSLDMRHFGMRQARLLAAALMVTAGSYALFPKSYIYFGILHFIFAASLIGRLFLRIPNVAMVSGLLVIAAGLGFSNPVFDLPYLQWIGLMTHKPYTEDYVPIFPWLGVVLIGIFLGNLLFVKLKPAWIYRECPKLKIPSFLGRHSLAVYLLHQPILIGVLYTVIGH